MSKVHPLTRYRKSRGLTLKEAAGLFDVERSTIIRWEQGKTRIPIKRLTMITKVTGIPRHELRPDLAEMFGGEAA